MRQIIFFCGHAGTGKTTLAKRFVTERVCGGAGSLCLLDKDTLYGGYSSAVMQVLTGDGNDRDSPLYLQHLRNPEYAGLLATARENLELGVTPVVVGPLSCEVKSKELFNPQWLGVPADTRITVVWVHLPEAEARRRIQARGNPNDAWKLAHWDDYRKRLFQPSVEEYPELIQFDNSRPGAPDFETLASQILQARARP